MLFELNKYISGPESFSIAFFESRGHIKLNQLWRLIKPSLCLGWLPSTEDLCYTVIIVGCLLAG